MKSKRWAGLLAAAMSALVVAAVVAPGAQAATPAPGYEQFTGCPTPTEYPEEKFCLNAEITGGHFQMGSKDVPISNPINLVGGVKADVSGFQAGPGGGLYPVKEKVPGGVVGLTGLTWLLEFLGSEALTLYAVTELAGTPNLSNPESVQLPVKVHLINSVLGNNCYVGSNSNPINLDLITGTTNPPPPNEPITGKGPEISFEAAREIIEYNNITYVDNSFAAPGANGCVLKLFGFIPISLNSIVDLQSGLPSAAGTNETVQYTDLHITPATRAFP